MADSKSRLLLLDVPLALVIGSGSLAVARIFAELSQQPLGRSGAEFPMGPPWAHPGRGHVETWSPPSFRADLGEPYTWIALIWVLILMLGIAFRRVRPRTGYAITVVGATGYLAAGLPFGPVLVAPALGLVTMAMRLSVRRWAPWTVLLAPMIWAGFVSEDYFGLTDPTFYSTLIMLSAAMLMPALFATLRRNRLDAGRRTRQLELRRAAYQERLRIARDVHDLIGHSLSVINMQAGVALYVLDKERGAGAADGAAGDSTKITESLQAIRSTSKNALDELRATLGVFRGEATDTGEQRAPVAGLQRVPELVASFRRAGGAVELIMDDTVDDLPGPVDSAAYRIVQEGLTNVAKHAGRATATVRIHREPESLVIDISDDGPPVRSTAAARDSGGNGLIGMAERASSVGGTVWAGPLPDRGFGVHAEFPLLTNRSTT
ncbi:sensor histidine kinase [Microlunatus elymi]|uniref:sensor histidine kinase n=1 Tax=Microlunatus elymi TaxID=2596828 RepID=UPI00143DE683|nr:sensor histidine kinase [Microlunatus elymi]